MSFSLKGEVYRIAKEYLFTGVIVLFLGVAGVLLPYLYDGGIVDVQAGSSSLPTTDTSSWIKLIYTNNQYNYFFSSSTSGVYNIYLVTSTNGADNTWSEPTTTISTIKPSIDGEDAFPIYDIQYNASSSYFGATYYVSSTDVLVYTTSTDGVTWGATNTIYTYAGEAGEEWVIGMDYLEGTDYVAITYEFDKVALSSDAGVTWATSSVDVFDPNTEDLMTVNVTAGPILHTVFKDNNSNYFYASSTDSGNSWTTTTIHETANGSSINLSKFSVDGNGRPSLLLGDTLQGGIGVATSSMIFASLESGVWTTSTIGINSYSYSDDTASADMGFYGAKPYMVYYGNSNYANFVYSTSTDDPFIFTTSSIGGANAVGETSKMSTTYDSANTTVAVAYVAASGELRFATSSVDLVSEEEGEEEGYDGNLPVLDTDAKTKLLWVDNVYYLAFSSSSADGIYDVYITTSTDGSAGTWSEPQEVVTGIWGAESYGKAFFAFEYNSNDSYFGLASFATGTSRIDFTTSSDASTWSATSTVADHLPTDGEKVRRLYLDFGTSDSYIALFYSNYDQAGGTGSYELATSTNGSSWSTTTVAVINNGDQDNFAGGAISGSGASRVFHTAFYETDLSDIVYSSSTDGGSTWTSTTVAAELNTNGPAEATISLAVDDNGLPGLVYHNTVTSSMPNVTTTIIYNKKGNDGVWTSSTVQSNIANVLTANPEPGAFTFFNTDDPLIAYMGDSLYPYWAVNTSTDFVTSNISSNSMGISSEMGLAYDTTDEEVAVAYVSGGQLYFATSSLVAPASILNAPTGLTATLSSNTQIDLSWDSVSGADSYELYRDTSINFTNTTTIASAGTSYEDTGLTPGTQYHYKVATVNSVGTSTPSAFVSGIVSAITFTTHTQYFDSSTCGESAN
jgi:hypothetical protein